MKYRVGLRGAQRRDVEGGHSGDSATVCFGLFRNGDNRNGNTVRVRWDNLDTGTFQVQTVTIR